MSLSLNQGLGGAGLADPNVGLGGAGLQLPAADGGVVAVDQWEQKDFQGNPETVGGGVRMDVFWKADGLRVWSVRDSSNRCDQHDVSPAWSIQSGDWTNRVSDAVNFIDPRGLWISPDGTRLMNNMGSGQFRASTMSTPFDLSTVGVFSNTNMGTNHLDHYWSNDGTRLWMYFISGVPNTIREYAVATPFDVSTIVPNPFTDVARFDLTPDIAGIRSFQFNTDGTILYAIGTTLSPGSLVQWTLGTAFDITTAGSFVQGITVGTAGEMANPRGLVYRPTDGFLYAFRDQGSPQNVKLFGPP